MVALTVMVILWLHLWYKWIINWFYYIHSPTHTHIYMCVAHRGCSNSFLTWHVIGCPMHLSVFFSHCIVSNSLASCILASIAFCDLWASIFLTQTRTCSLVTSLVFMIIVSPLIISDVMALSFMLLMNCSFSCVSNSWEFTNSFTLAIGQLIQSSLLSLLSLSNLQYCNDRIVSVQCGLNFSFCVLYSPVLLLHIPCSSVVNVSLKWRLSLPYNKSLVLIAFPGFWFRLLVIWLW